MSVARLRADNRLFVEAVLYRYGATFLPVSGAGKTCIGDCAAGVIERIFRHLAADHDDEYMMIDSTIVRVHQHRAGALKKGIRIRPPDDHEAS